MAIDELKSTDGILDLMGDTEQSLSQQRTNKRKWDPVSHKYVTAQSLEKKQVKKIKSESGHWIPMTYKSDRYEKWQEKSKLKNSASEENNEEEEKKIAPCMYCYDWPVNYKNNSIVRIHSSIYFINVSCY